MIFYLIFTIINVSLVFVVENGMLFHISILQKLSKKKAMLFILSLSCLISIIVISSRNIEMADDTYNYYEFFNGPYTGFAEYGFFLLTKFIRLFTSNFHIFLLITTTLSIAPFYIILNKITKNKWIYLFLYHVFLLYIFNFAIIRQCIAMSLVMMGVYFFSRAKIQRVKRILLFLFFTLIGALFHRISFFILPVLLFEFITFDRKKIMLLIILPLLFIVFKEDIINFIFTSLLPEKAIYLNEQTGIENFGIIPFIVFCAIACTNILIEKKCIIQSKNNLLVNINYYFIYICLFFYWFPAYGRILQFGYLNAAFLLGSLFDSEFLSKGKNKWKCLLICLLFYIYMLSRNPYHVIPYFI